jgi:uncharacterized protein YacL
MIWFVLLILFALVMVLFGFWLTVTRIRDFREMVEVNRVKAFAEMAQIAKKAEEEKNLDSRV